MTEGENVTVENTVVEAVEITPEQVEFQKQMDYAFNDAPPATVEVVNEEAPVSEADQDVVVNQEAPVTTVDYNAFVKENFGFETLEDAKAELEALKALKNTPATPKEIEFANEESKKIHELIREGKTKEVKAYLEAQELLSNVDTMSSEQQLKLYIKMQNPKFDKELIEDEYNSLYTLNEDEMDVLEPLAQRKLRLKLEQRLESDVEKAQEHFATYKQKLQLPEITPSTTIVDEEYEAYKASNAEVSDRVNNVLVPAIQSLKESDVQLNFKVSDAKNQMEFDVALAPTSEQFEKARQDSLSFDNFINRVCYDKDGNFIPANVQRLILLNDNFDNYAQAIARQAVNAERVRTIAKEAPNTSQQRDFTVNQEKTEFQKMMDAAFA